jgi:hypothetical protein
MKKDGEFFWNTYRAQKIIAQWIVDGNDFIDIFSGQDWFPLHDPDDADEHPERYIPFWYEHEQKAVEKLADYLNSRGYKGFENGKWIK